eukprot:COSAG01_NODE_275_length_19669_cov_8.676188_6_plen_157_part_00
MVAAATAVAAAAAAAAAAATAISAACTIYLGCLRATERVIWLCCCQAEFSSMTAWAEELAKTATLDSAAGDAPPKSEAEEYGIKHFTVRVLGRPFHPERWCERCAACCHVNQPPSECHSHVLSVISAGVGISNTERASAVRVVCLPGGQACRPEKL